LILSSSLCWLKWAAAAPTAVCCISCCAPLQARDIIFFTSIMRLYQILLALFSLLSLANARIGGTVTPEVCSISIRLMTFRWDVGDIAGWNHFGRRVAKTTPFVSVFLCQILLSLKIEWRNRSTKASKRILQLQLQLLLQLQLQLPNIATVSPTTSTGRILRQVGQDRQTLLRWWLLWQGSQELQLLLRQPTHLSVELCKQRKAVLRWAVLPWEQHLFAELWAMVGWHYWQLLRPTTGVPMGRLVLRRLGWREKLLLTDQRNFLFSSWGSNKAAKLFTIHNLYKESKPIGNTSRSIDGCAGGIRVGFWQHHMEFIALDRCIRSWCYRTV